MSISLATRKAYSELDSFIELLDEYEKEKVPLKLREYFKKEKDNTYIKEINPDMDIKNQNLRQETLALIAYLNLQYWCESEEEKQKLIDIYTENDKKIANEHFDNHKLFDDNNSKVMIVNESEEKHTSLKIQKLNIFQRIINFLKRTKD